MRPNQNGKSENLGSCFVLSMSAITNVITASLRKVSVDFCVSTIFDDYWSY